MPVKYIRENPVQVVKDGNVTIIFYESTADHGIELERRKERINRIATAGILKAYEENIKIQAVKQGT